MQIISTLVYYIKLSTKNDTKHTTEIDILGLKFASKLFDISKIYVNVVKQYSKLMILTQIVGSALSRKMIGKNYKEHIWGYFCNIIPENNTTILDQFTISEDTGNNTQQRN